MSYSSDCKICVREVVVGAKGVSCDGCEDWHHLGCVNITNKIYKSLYEAENLKINIKWYCKDCDEKIKLFLSQNSAGTRPMPAQTKVKQKRVSTNDESIIEVYENDLLLDMTKLNETIDSNRQITLENKNEPNRPIHSTPKNSLGPSSLQPKAQMGLGLSRRETSNKNQKTFNRPSDKLNKNMCEERYDVLIIGDSIVKNLYTRFNNYGLKSKVISLPGENIYNICKKVKEVLKEDKLNKNGWIVLQGGGNYLKNVGIDRTYQEVKGTVDYVKNAYPLIKFSYIPISPRKYENQSFNTKRINFNQLLRKLTSTNGGNTIEMGEDLERWNMWLKYDGVHFTDSGTNVLAREIKRWIWSLRQVENFTNRPNR